MRYTLARFDGHLEIIKGDNPDGRRYSTIDFAYDALSRDDRYRKAEIFYHNSLVRSDKDFLLAKMKSILDKENKNKEEKIFLYILSKNIETLLV